MPKFLDQNKEPHFNSAETDEYVFAPIKGKKGTRLLYQDGTFNIERRGVSRSNLYELYLGMSWPRIIISFFFFFFIINGVFALAFMLIGPENIDGVKLGSPSSNYTQMLHFSIQTFTTVGYGNLSPTGVVANILASFVAFIGLLVFAIFTGLSFAKFSKPQAHILFSKKMLIAPNPKDDNAPSLQFRIVNSSKNQIIDLEARVTLAWLENIGGKLKRRFIWLDLELESIHLFPLNWTLIHKIDEQSPLFGRTREEMIEEQMEVLVLIKGFDDTYSRTIHSKRSYSFTELIVGAQFTSMYDSNEEKTILNIAKLDEYVKYNFETYAIYA